MSDTPAPQPASVLDIARLARAFHQLSFEETDPTVVRVPAGATDELIRQLASNATRIWQIIPLFPGTTSIDEFSRLVWCDLASRRKEVRRLYLIPKEAKSDLAEKRIAADRASTVDARGVVVSLTSQPTIPMIETWLVDDAVIRREGGRNGAPNWVVSVRPEHVLEAQQLWETLWQRSDNPLAGGLVDLTDPLLESADMIYETAKVVCTHNHVDRASCEWYHGVWQYLRLLDMASSPTWHSEFYGKWLRHRMNNSAQPRVLITGTADYSMLAFVLFAAQEHPSAEVHVLDHCQTPLYACRWYAKYVGARVHLHDIDFLDDHTQVAGKLRAGSPSKRSDFDLIVSDAFLTRFRREQAQTVLANWAWLLNPDGMVVTTVRLHPRDSDRFGLTQDVSRFVLRLRERLEAWRWPLKIDDDELIDRGREYALKMTSWDLGDLDEVVRLFDATGLTVIHREIADVPGELCQSVYARLVATKTQQLHRT